MNVMQRFTIRSLKLNKKWTIVTIIGIIISTAMITAVATFSTSFMVLMQNETIANSGNWHSTVSDVQKKDIPAFEHAKFVKEVMISRNIGYAKLDGAKNASKPYLYIKQYDANSNKNFHTTLVSGRMPKNDGELVLSQDSQINSNIKYFVGDKITLSVGKRVSSSGSYLMQQDSFEAAQDADKQANTPSSSGEKFVAESTKTYTIVGIIKRPNFESSWSPGYTALTYLDIKTLHANESVNVSLLSNHLTRQFYNDVNGLAKSIGLNSKSIVYNNELLRYYGIVRGDNLQSTIYSFAFVMILIIIIASVSLIYNAFAISVSERTRQLGMLASVGATKKQKRQNVYFEGFLIALIGIPAGILAGIGGIGITIQLIRPLMQSFMRLGSSGLHLVVSPMSIVVAVVFASVTILISAWIPARRASKIMPIDAIRQSKEIKLTDKSVKTSKLTRALFGFEGEIALKNLKRSRKKYRATVLSLIISLVLFLTVSYYAEFANRASTTSSMGINYDLRVDYTNTTLSQSKAMNRKIAALDLVTGSAKVEIGYGSFLLSGSQLPETTKQLSTPNKQGKYELSTELYCLDSASFKKYAQAVGVNPKEYQDSANPKAIVVNYAQTTNNEKHVAGKIIDMKSGESLHLISYASAKNNQSIGIDIQLGALTDKRPMGMLIQSFDRISIVVSEKVFASYKSKLPATEQNTGETIYLNTTNSDKLETQIDNLTKNNISSNNVTIWNIAANAKSEHDSMLFLAIFIYGFIILISLICIANIFNTISTNINLRRKEFAMLRSVGMTPKGFNKMIRFESIFYGLKGLLYGLPISAGIGILLYKIQGSSFEFGFSLPWASYGVAIVLIFIIVMSTMLYSSAKMKKENIIDALKDENM
ncbi:MAG: FtsX-like permease family protein [Clostridia bacterium]|jgi:putative ABC transport system permease protein